MLLDSNAEDQYGGRRGAAAFLSADDAAVSVEADAADIKPLLIVIVLQILLILLTVAGEGQRAERKA